MTEYQAAILLAQMKRLEAQTQRRWENATYLLSKIQNIPGIIPHRHNPGVTRASYHAFPFRFNKAAFDGVSRQRFIAALRAEGVPCSPGYDPLNREPFFENILNSKNFRRMYSKEQLEHCRQQNHCPANDALCEENIRFSQVLLLGERSDMDDIAEAMHKVYDNRAELAG
jgi:perosamine synthetase